MRRNGTFDRAIAQNRLACWLTVFMLFIVLFAAGLPPSNVFAEPEAGSRRILVEDFEGDLLGWAMNDALKATGQKPDVTLTTMSLVKGAPGPTGPHGGKRCLQIDWLPGAGWANTYVSRDFMGDQWAALGVDEVAFWLRGDGQDKQVLVDLQCCDDELRSTTFTAPVSLKDATWHEVVIPLTRFQQAHPDIPLRLRGLTGFRFDGTGELAPARLWVDDIVARNARDEGAAFAALPDADKLTTLPPANGLPRLGTFFIPRRIAAEKAKALGLSFLSNGDASLPQSRAFALDGFVSDYVPNRMPASAQILGLELKPEDIDQDAQGRPMGEGVQSSVFHPGVIEGYCRLMAECIRVRQGAPWIGSVGLVSPISLYGEQHYSASSAGQYAVFSRPAKENFRGWLKRQYGGDLAALNRAWGQSYTDWMQIVPPAGPAGPAGQIDTRTTWSDFMHWYNGWSDEVLRRMLAAARPETAKPILIWLGGPKVGALQGISLGNIGPYVKMLGQVKPSIIDDTDAQTIFSVKYTATACNQYGVGLEIENVGPPGLQPYLQYNTIFNMLAGGADHLRVSHLGELYDAHHWFGRLWSSLAPLVPRYHTAYQKSDAAFFHSYVTSWYRPDRSNADGLWLYDATNSLWVPDRHFPSWGRALGSPDVLDDMMIEDGGLAGRKLLVIPNTSVTVTTRKTMDAIRRWVEGGGTLIGFGEGCLAWTVEPDRSLRATPLMGGLLPADAFSSATARTAAEPGSISDKVEARVGQGRVTLYRSIVNPMANPAFPRAMLPVLRAEAGRAGVRRWCRVEDDPDETVNLVYCGKDLVTGRHLFALDLMTRSLPQPEFVTDRRLDLTFDPALAGEAELVAFSDSFTSCAGGTAEFDPKAKLLTARFQLPGKVTLNFGKAAAPAAVAP